MDRKTNRRVWVVSILLTLFLHAAALVGLLASRPFTPDPVEARAPEPIELVFASEPTPTRTADEPSQFTELPADRADEAPENPDFLSNVTSRARDLAAGGDENMPRMEGEGEAPHLRMDPGAPGAPAPAEPELAEDGEPEGEAETTAREEAPGGDRAEAVTEADPRDAVLDPSRTARESELSPVIKPNPDQEPVRDPQDQQAGSAAPNTLLRPGGMDDLFQQEMHNPHGNVALDGDISLNTVAWNYAPWLMQFRRDFVRNWYAPPAYYMGIIDGWTTIEVEIDHGGGMMRLDVLEEIGHPSLTQTSTSAFDATAPFRPLPGDFPEETLVLRIKLLYPQVRRR